MDTEPITDPPIKPQPPLESPSLFDRFQSAYNEIDAYMRKATGCARDVGFASVQRDFEKRHNLGIDGNFLRSAAELRNVLIHNSTLPYFEMAVPTEGVVQRIEHVRELILRPPRIYPMFRKDVVSVAPDESLAHVMHLVAEMKFSQFPVMDGVRFTGLLTENGITRWLARKVVVSMSLVELEDAKVRDLVSEEEKRNNVQFVSRQTSVAEVLEIFRNNGFLEAVLITENGQKAEKLLGMMSRWDLAQIAGR